MASKTRALVDAVYDWSRYNTLPRAYGWIVETLKRDPTTVGNLIVDTLQYGNKGTVKRIEYLLAQLGVARLRRATGNHRKPSYGFGKPGASGDVSHAGCPGF